MYFQEFWKKLTNELKHQKRYRTLKRSKIFKAEFKDPSTITITPNSKIHRDVPIVDFQGMWKIMKNDAKNERYINTKKRYYRFWSSSYISALIDHVVSDENMQ